MALSPIGISTYSRVDHLKKNIAALQKSALAPQSELYIFSDAPKMGDEEKVQAVRDFLKTVNGFKCVEIVERKTNSRTYNNRQGMRMLLESYGKMIFMEEDIVTAPSFLEYMNYMLDAYEDNPRIFSIAGYCPPIEIPADYPYDVFLHPRFNPWGFGIWKDRFDKLEMKIPKHVLHDIYLNPKKLWQFSRGGMEMLPYVLNNYFEYRNGLDIRVFPQQFHMNMLTVYPVRHLVDNIGLDGSGVHKKRKDRYRVTPTQEAFKTPSLPESMEPDKRIMKAVYKFRSGSFLTRLKYLAGTVAILLKRLMVGKGNAG